MDKLNLLYLNISKMLIGSAVCVFVILFITAIRSGYLYTFDNDELSHAQVVYLILQGQKPFISFFSIYSPLFHWILVPIFQIFGSTFSAISASRVFMIMLFVLRVGLGSLLTARLFSPLAALFFAFLLVLDPITVFTGMQIRPDNIMLVFFTAGLYVLLNAIEQKKVMFYAASGLLFGLALIASVKALPGVGVVVIGMLLSALIHRTHIQKLQITTYIFFLILPIIVFSSVFILNGSFPEMLRQLVFDAPATNKAILYPLPVGNFYWPNNYALFGFAGRPLTWMYVWILPALAFMGSAVVFRLKKSLFATLLVGILFAYWISLFLIPSVFIQYYLPLTWLYALFAAGFVDDLLSQASGNKRIYSFTLACTLGCCLVFAFPSIQANIHRSALTADGLIKYFEARWATVPPGAATFPNLLFRPLSYPLPYGYYLFDLPVSIRSRYPAVETILKTSDVPYVLFKPQEVEMLSAEASLFIQKNYTYVDELELWRRNARN